MQRMEGNDGGDSQRRPKWSDLPELEYHPLTPETPQAPPLVPEKKPDTPEDPRKEIERLVNLYRGRLPN